MFCSANQQKRIGRGSGLVLVGSRDCIAVVTVLLVASLLVVLTQNPISTLIISSQGLVNYDSTPPQREPTILEISGVNLVDSWESLPSQIQIALDTGFNTVRFRCDRFLGSFLQGLDEFTPIFERMPDEVKLIPMLFRVQWMDVFTVLKEEDRFEEWLDFWLQPAFQQKYATIEVMNEPFLKNHQWDILSLEDLRELTHDVRVKSTVPVSIGFAYRLDQSWDVYEEQVKYLEPYLDWMSWHVYDEQDGYLERIQWTIDWLRQFNKPILISEFNSRGGATEEHPEYYSEQNQTTWIAHVLRLFKQAKIKGYAFHNLREPSHLEPYPPWGIYRRDWTPKPCATLFP